MKLFFRIIIKLSFMFIILSGSATGEEIKENDPDTLLNQGIAFGEEGQWDQAIAYFNKAIEINPRYAKAYNIRGIAYYSKDQIDKAIADFNKAIEIDPKDSSPYNNRGVAYLDKGEYEKAWDDVHKAESLGHRIHPEFLKALREASGRQK